MIVLYIILSILVLGGKFTFFAWLLYEKFRGANSITLALMLFFGFLCVDHITNSTTVVLQYYEIFSGWGFFAVIVNDMFLIVSMVIVLGILFKMRGES